MTVRGMKRGKWVLKNIRVTIGPFVEVSIRSGLKVNADKSKAMVLVGDEMTSGDHVA